MIGGAQLIPLVFPLHGVHTGGADIGWIGPLGISVLILATLALSSRRARKKRGVKDAHNDARTASGTKTNHDPLR
jgi:hypothetical protein